MPRYETGVGPCVDAFRQRQIFRIADMDKDHQ